MEISYLYDEEFNPIPVNVFSGYIDERKIGIANLKLTPIPNAIDDYSTPRKPHQTKTHIIDLHTCTLSHINSAREKYKQWKINNKIEYCLGNKGTNDIFEAITSKSKDGIVTNGYEEITLIEPRLFFTKIATHLNDFTYESERLERELKQEIDSFDLNLALENKESYPKLFSIACVLLSIDWNEPNWLIIGDKYEKYLAKKRKEIKG